MRMQPAVEQCLAPSMFSHDAGIGRLMSPRAASPVGSSGGLSLWGESAFLSRESRLSARVLRGLLGGLVGRDAQCYFTAMDGPDRRDASCSWCKAAPAATGTVSRSSAHGNHW